MTNVKEILKKYMIILLMEYSSEAGVSGMKKVKNPLIFFLNLEKFNGIQSQICKIIVNDQEKTDPNIILNEIRNFLQNFF